MTPPTELERLNRADVESLVEDNEMPCGTCGKDIRTAKQLIECRKHYVEEIERLRAENERILSHVLSAAKSIDIAEDYCTDMGQSIALGHAMESLGLALRWPVLECGIDRSALKVARQLEEPSE